MEAPQKIYLTLIEDGLHCYTEEIPFEREHIEYIRKDAFIKKACEYFAPHISDNSDGYDRARIIEQFKKYMET